MGRSDRFAIYSSFMVIGLEKKCKVTMLNFPLAWVLNWCWFLATGVTEEHAHLEKDKFGHPTALVAPWLFRGLTSITRPGSYRITSMKPDVTLDEYLKRVFS